VTGLPYEGVLGPGAEVGGFVIESVAGRGGMGVVYRARQREPDRVVALKVIAPEFAGDPGFQERFKSEARIAAQIEHPNVIPVYAVGEDRGILYLAMRFVAGTDLRLVITQEGSVDPPRAAAILDQVAQALDAAHGRGLVHRDVKPANILITRAGGREHVYLTDFGLSRHVEASQALTGTGAFVGTVDYVAPEQVRGERVDARTDVYSLGCVLFHSLTGRVPFPEGNQLAKLYAHGSQPPPSVCDCVPGLPPTWDAIVARAMAKDPDERYQSAGDLGAAVVAAVEAAPVTRAERTVATGDAAPLRDGTGVSALGARRWPTVAALIAPLVVAGVAIGLSVGGSGGSGAHGGTAARGGSGASRGSATGTPRDQLLALIPAVIRSSCMPAAQGVADPSAVVSVECGLAGIDAVYEKFPNDSVMNQWFALTRESAGIAPLSGSCTAARFSGEAPLTIGGAPRGRYLCVLDSGEPRLYTTDERFAVGMMLDYYAGKGPAAIESLLRQWRCCTQLANQP
jgi:hypothetical protein